MQSHDDATYDDPFAATYDKWITISADGTERAVACLPAPTGAGPILEIGRCTPAPHHLLCA